MCSILLSGRSGVRITSGTCNIAGILKNRMPVFYLLPHAILNSVTRSIVNCIQRKRLTIKNGNDIFISFEEVNHDNKRKTT